MHKPPDLSEASDQDLVARARDGDQEAYGELLRRHVRSIYKFVHRMVRDYDLADDLTQEVFVKAFSKLESHRPEHSFSSWILKIASNHVVNHLKREQRLRRRRLDTVPLEPTPDASSPRRLMAGGMRRAAWTTPTPKPRDVRALVPALEEALARLKETYRRCLILREIEARSYEDIAEIMDLPVGTVSTCLHRARRELRAALDPLREALEASSLTPT